MFQSHGIWYVLCWVWERLFFFSMAMFLLWSDWLWFWNNSLFVVCIDCDDGNMDYLQWSAAPFTTLFRTKVHVVVTQCNLNDKYYVYGSDLLVFFLQTKRITGFLSGLWMTFIINSSIGNWSFSLIIIIINL